MELYVTFSASYTVRHRIHSLLHSHTLCQCCHYVSHRKWYVTLSYCYPQIHVLLPLRFLFFMQECDITYNWTVHICLKFLSDTLRFSYLVRYIQTSKLQNNWKFCGRNTKTNIILTESELCFKQIYHLSIKINVALAISELCMSR